MMPEQQQRILGYFIEEAKDHLNTIEQGLLNLQATIEDPEMVTEVFRAAHSVKGGAAMLGLDSIQRTSHRLEDYFKVLKESPATRVDRQLESMFLQVFDGLQALLEELQGPFGLTEDKAQDVMTELEPVFDHLEQHLNTLVDSSAAASTVAETKTPVSQRPPRRSASSSEESALKLVFSSDVPGHLRQMLTLFKQPDTEDSRTSLQACCDALRGIGEQFDLNRWCDLISTTRRVVGNSEQTYRALAPVVIKELKRAQEQVLSGQAESIEFSTEFEALIPISAEPEESFEDIDSLLDDALVEPSDETNLAELFRSDAQPAADSDDDLDWLETSATDTAGDELPDLDDLDASMEAFSASGSESDSSSDLENREPFVGAAELNSLADLFEGEISGLDSPWEEISEREAAIADNIGQDTDISSDDFSDLLEDSSEANSVDSQNDLAELFGEAGSENGSVASDLSGQSDLDSTPVSETEEFSDLFDLAIDADADAGQSEGSDVNESVELDALLDLPADATDIENETGSPPEDEIFPTDESTPDDFEGLFEDSGNVDLESELDNLTEVAAPVERDNDIQSTTETADEATASDENLEPLTDSAGGSFEAIADPWTLQESEEDLSDDSALEALDELWTESHPTDSQEESAATETLDDDDFSDFDELASATDESTDIDEFDELTSIDSLTTSIDDLADGSDGAESDQGTSSDIFSMADLAAEDQDLDELFESPAAEDVSLEAELGSLDEPEDLTDLLDASVSAQENELDGLSVPSGADRQEAEDDGLDELFNTSTTSDIEASLEDDLLSSNDADDDLDGFTTLFDESDDASADELSVGDLSEEMTELGAIGEMEESPGSDSSAEIDDPVEDSTDLDLDALLEGETTDAAESSKAVDLDDALDDLLLNSEVVSEPVGSPDADEDDTLSDSLFSLEDSASEDEPIEDPRVQPDSVSEVDILELDVEEGTDASNDSDIDDLFDSSETLPENASEQPVSQADDWEADEPDTPFPEDNIDSDIADAMDEQVSRDVPPQATASAPVLDESENFFDLEDYPEGTSPDSDFNLEAELLPTDLSSGAEEAIERPDVEADIDDFFDTAPMVERSAEPAPDDRDSDATVNELSLDDDLAALDIGDTDSDDTAGVDTAEPLESADILSEAGVDSGDRESSEETVFDDAAFDDGRSAFELDDLDLDSPSETDSEIDSEGASDIVDALSSDELDSESDVETDDLAFGALEADLHDDAFLEGDQSSIDEADPLLTQDIADTDIAGDPDIGDSDIDALDAYFEESPTDDVETADVDITADDSDGELSELDSLLADSDFLADDESDVTAVDSPFPEDADSSDNVDSIDIVDDSSLDELDALLEDSSAAPEDSPANDLETAIPISPDDDFEELDALLGDEDFSGASEQSETLGVEAPSEPSTVDFDELETLLENESTTSTIDSPVDESDTADVGDEFSDLEKLLEEADQALGGAPSVRSTGVGRSTRRIGGMVDQTMRVSVNHLDNLNNLVGELVVNRNSLEQDQDRLRQFLDNLLFQVQQLNDVGQRMRDLYERSLLESSLLTSRQIFQNSPSHSSGMPRGNGDSHATGATFDALEMDRFTGFHTLTQEMIELIVRVRESASDIAYTVESTDQITRQFRQVTTQLQEGLNKARMVPFAQTADRLPRAVRDISIRCGKEARLVVEGRDTLIDKMILERLYDPMTHLVNNAITHGIETPDERAAAGKPREGTITVRAFYQGNQTVIYIADDGGGINPDVVKRKAIQRGLITQAEANTMNTLETYELLFCHGFSTRDKADDFAGRGVGMDVVRTALSEIRGSITIDSELGRGTSFTIRLPLTLSISKALSCLNNQARIAFPMDGVEDMFDVPKERIQTDDNNTTCIQWRDTLLTFQPLSELLQFNRSLGRGRVYGGSQDDDIVSIVVLRSANTFIGIQVDRVLGEQEIVIKQIEGPVPKPMGIAGATVLGDGRVMPIGDVLELIDIAQGRVRREAGSSLWSQVSEPPDEDVVDTKTEPTVLIVDDSITVRELLSMSFNKVGYRVEQARDGQEAWEKLRSGLPCELVFCDIEMPRMDGLELLSRMQKDSLLKRIPIAMLTSRGADRHRQMAVDLGASGYFTKPYLEEALLDAAQRMLNGEVLLKGDENPNE